MYVCTVLCREDALAGRLRMSVSFHADVYVCMYVRTYIQ